ncbi:MAG: DUF5060 domain-containing protein [Microscillaceae bacterium]|nr:DUF5060 domain-containing protein [Microscillaceae bacterium]
MLQILLRAVLLTALVWPSFSSTPLKTIREKAEIKEAAYTWVTLSDAILPRAEAQSTVVNGKLYVFGGFNEYYGGSDLRITDTCEVYDPATDTWTYLGRMPIPVTHLGIVADGDRVWLPGGFEGDNPGVAIAQVQIYNTDTNAWSLGPDLPEPMASHAVARLDRKLHIFGGLKPNRQTNNPSHYVLDLDNLGAGWQRKADLPQARNHLSGIALNGKIYAIGGQFGHDGPHQDVDLVHVYDPFSDTWTQVASLPQTRSHFEHCTLLTQDGKILIMGGRTNNVTSSSNNTILEYDPDTNTWTFLSTLPTGLIAPNAGIINNFLYVSHGGSNWQNPGNKLYRTDFVRPPLLQLGFQPQEITVVMEKDQSLQKVVHLWTSSQTANYTIPTNALPAWVSVANPTGTTDTYAKEINLQFNTNGMVSGNYSTTLTATAPGFSPTTLTIHLQIVPQQVRVLYIYGEVDANGYLPSDPSFNGTLYQPMRLQDSGNRGLSMFRMAIEELGFEIEERYDQDITLTESFLSNYEVVILGSNQKIWAASEVAALNAWVRAGGGLIGYSDSAFGGAWNNPPPAGLSNQQGRDSDNQLMAQFGMFFFTDQGGAGGDNLVNNWTMDHFLNTKNNIPQSLRFRGEGVSPIRIQANWPEKQACDTVYQIAPHQNGGAGGPVSINDPDLGNGIQNYAIDCALAAAEIGTGRVIGTFDRNNFWNNGEGTDIEEEDNRLFAQKLVQWAARAPLRATEVVQSGELKQWHKITLTFEGPQTHEAQANNPFLNYRLNVTFSNGNKTHIVPGHYAADGNAAQTSAYAGNKWQVHFCPDETGNWEYEVSFRTGNEVAVAEESCAGIANFMDGHRGYFYVGLSDKTGRDFRSKGRLQYVGERYLRFANGEYFLKGGADSPETLLAYTDFDSTYNHEGNNNLKTWTAHLGDWQTGDPTWQGSKGQALIGALNYLAQKGNNAFSFLTYNAGGDGKKRLALSPTRWAAPL